MSYFQNQIGGLQNYISVEETSNVHIKKWRCNEKQYKIRFPVDCDSFADANVLVNNIFTELYEYIKLNSKPKDKVRVVFGHPSLINNISCPFMDIDDFSAKLMIQMLQRVSQSKRELKTDQDLLCMAQIVDLPVGSGNRMNEFMINKDCVKIVRNDDNLCALRAILIKKAYADKQVDKRDYTLFNSKKLEEALKRITNKLSLPNEPY